MKVHYHTSSLTKKGQVHIPVSIREKLNISAPARFKITIQGRKIILEQEANSLLQLAGALKGQKPIRPLGLENIRDSIDYSQL